MYLGKSALLFLGFLTTIISIEGVINYDDERFSGQTADTYDWENHPCRRTCYNNPRPLRCYYVFVVEQYSSLSKACYDCPNNVTDCFRPHCVPADGTQREIYTINRRMPGPSIEVCEGDTIVVDVRNTMLSDNTAIHWHGIKQNNTPYSDGVPFVTQCPIMPGETFRYTFKADTGGTFFYHSHIGNQRADGVYGALVIYPKIKNNYWANLYEADEHYMIVSDWSQISADAAMIKEYHDRTEINPTNILVNGMGRQITSIGNATQTNGPNYVFNVKQNQKNRFRMINAGAEDCPIEMTIDNHVLQVISLDSEDILAAEVDTITIWPGERVDFIVYTNQKVDNYWIRYRGYGLCQNRNNTNVGVYQVAVLRYKGAPIQDPTSRIAYDIPRMNNKTRVLNPYQKGTESPPWTNINIPQLTSVRKNGPALTRRVDQQIYISFDFYQLDNYDFHRQNLYGYNQVAPIRRIGTLQLNHISLKLPSFPLLSQRNQIKPGDLCDSTTIPANCTSVQCSCTHVICIRLNSVVELVFVDEGKYAVINHPLHLHGHFFRIIATENLKGNVTVDRIKQLDREGKIKRRLDGAPLKDTMKAPGGGYTIVRFYANNPGYWFLHCHFDQHNNVGMALIFKVGEDRQMLEVPRNFPTCGNYEPFVNLM